jgi:hypothetical protein
VLAQRTTNFTTINGPQLANFDATYTATTTRWAYVGIVSNSRMGDYRFDIKQPRKIKKILYYPKNIRYLLEGHDNVSYTEAELMPSKEQAEKYVVKKILDKKKVGRKVYYLIWWRGYLKKNATYEPETELLKDGLKPIIDEFNNRS